MFPLSNPDEIRRKLEALFPPNTPPQKMTLSPGPLLYINQQFYPLPMGYHGNIAAVDDAGVLLHMGAYSDLALDRAPVPLPVVPPTLMAVGQFVRGGLHLRVPYTAIVDVWRDAGSIPSINLWLRHAVVMAHEWTLLPLLWPLETAAPSRSRA